MSNNAFPGQVISYDESVDLISDSAVQSEINLGHSHLYELLHPQIGRIIVLSSGVGASALINV